MSKIIANEERIGAFTSSNIYKLMEPAKHGAKFSEAGTTYIQEKKMEREIGRSLSRDFYTRDTSWGNFMEFVVFPKLAWGVEHCSDKTIVHPKYPFWVGSPDFLAQMRKVGELKCYQPKRFVELTRALITQDPMVLKYDFPQIYWQIGSNAVLAGVEGGDAMSFMPYRSELDAIRQMVDDYEGEDIARYKWIYDAEDHELAFLADDAKYSNLNIMEYEIPRDDREMLQERIIAAGLELIK